MFKKIKQYFKKRRIRKETKQQLDLLFKNIEERQKMSPEEIKAENETRTKQSIKDGWVQKKGGSWGEMENGGYRIQ